LKLIKPSFEIYPYDMEDRSIEHMIKRIEIACRKCYKSEAKAFESIQKSAEWIASIAIERKHQSILEHSSITVDFIFDRGISHELVRHRHTAFCLSGDSIIPTYSGKQRSLKTLYDMSKTPTGKANISNIRLRSVDNNQNIIPNKIKNIMYSGKKEVLEIETSNGYCGKASKDHIYFTPNGEKKLGDLKKGDEVYINGRPSLIKISDQQLTDMYLVNKLSPEEIATNLKVPYRSILRKLKQINIFQSHLNDNDKAKYNKNHTEESYSKMQKTIQDQYDNGRKVWNKDLTENDHPGIKIQANNLRINHHNNSFGEDNSKWNGSSVSYWRDKYINENKNCEMCYEPAQEVHHLDKDRTNNDFENLQSLCTKCHCVLHDGINVLKVTIGKITSIKSVGIEDTYDIEMEGPHHNFIANGFLVHNSQESTRYCNYSKDKFNKEINVITPFFFDPMAQRKLIKIPVFHHEFYNDKGQNEKTIKFIDEPNNNTWMMNAYDVWFLGCLTAEWCYNTLINDFGAVAQEARSVLPNSLKTEIRTTANIREWRHILSLRAAGTTGKPHPQIVEVCLPLLLEFQKKIPVLFDDIVIEAEKRGLLENGEIIPR
jgi:thymidylate synthase ThyX